MVWPIIRGKSYVGEAFKSMKAVGTAAAQKDGWRYIAITLIWPCAGHSSVSAWLRQLRTGITCVEPANWRSKAWQDGVPVLSPPARLEIGEPVWTRIPQAQ